MQILKTYISILNLYFVHLHKTSFKGYDSRNKIQEYTFFQRRNGF